MKRKGLLIAGIILVLIFLCLLALVPAAPFFVKLGIKPICIQGEWPGIKIVSCPQFAQTEVQVTPLPLPASEANGPISLIVDDDGSPDGLVALLFFLNNPLYDVKAATVSYGEAHPQVFAPRLAQFLAGLGRGDIPVGAGRDAPLSGSNAFPEAWREAANDFWGLEFARESGSQASGNQPPGLQTALPAAELMRKVISESSQPVVIFISGSHTNLADAIRLEPAISQKIRAIYSMGGAVRVGGNIHSDFSEIDNTTAEWNIWVDPLAASEVFSSGIPIHLIPLDATRRVLWTENDLSSWVQTGSPVGRTAGDILTWMLRNWQTEQVYIWDLVAAVQATNSALCPEETLPVEIVLEAGPEQGRTRVTEGVPNCSVCLAPDAAQVKALSAALIGK